MKTLYLEALEALKKNDNDLIVFSQEKSENITDLFERSVPMLTYGSGGVDWERLNSVDVFSSEEQLLPFIKEEKERVYLLWNQIDLPVVETTVIAVMQSIEDVCAVSFETWLLSEKERYVIELEDSCNSKIGFY